MITHDSGFQVIAAISAVAEHSIIHEYAAGRPNLDDYKVLAKFGEQVLEKASSNDFSKPSIPGNRPYKKARSGMIPKAGSACTSCMRCVSICPAHARKISSLMTSIAATAIKKACSVEKANELFM